MQCTDAERLLISIYLGPSGTYEVLSLSWLLVSLNSLIITVPSQIIKLERQSLSKQEPYKGRTPSSNSAAFPPFFFSRKNSPEKSAKSPFYLSPHSFSTLSSLVDRNACPYDIKHNGHSSLTGGHRCHLRNNNWVVLPM